MSSSITLTDMARSDSEKPAPRLKRMPLGRLLEPEEVAEVIAYLLSDRAAMVTGASPRADAAWP